MQLFMAQRCLRQMALVLLLVASCSATGRRFLEEDDPLVGYAKLPGTPSEEMVVEQNEAAKTAANWAMTEEASSALHAEAAENMEKAAESELITKAMGLKLKSATMSAIVSAQKASEMQKRAEASVKRARLMVAEMPAVALRAAGRAVDSVVAAAIHRMDQDATAVAEEQKAVEKKLAREAAKAAQIAALPWQQAKMRAGQTMVSYLSQGRDLANAVTQLKLQAPQLANQAGVLQARGDVVHAQEQQIAAHDLIDKADQLAGQAINFNKIANKINGGLGMYDLSASAAASYASYTANPGGGVGYQALPPLPTPLKLIQKTAGPSPAPAAASSPAA